MCGIFGFSLNRPLTEEDIARGRRATAMLAHRGPDGDGEWRDDPAGLYLGHRRLAILDLTSAGKQPMAGHGGVIAYNGEIYNHPSLRRELAAAGAVFESRTDTEVVLAAWSRWGAAALDRFDGMFAFALWRDGILHLATDPFGEKPLYWARTPDGIYFASEPAPLIAILGLTFDPTETDVAGFMALGFVPPPDTGFPGLFCVPPARHLRVSSGSLADDRPYWTPPAPRACNGPIRPVGKNDLSHIRSVLIESLEGRLISDAPIGLFLSAGIDSSLVAALVRRDLGRDLQALTVAFPDGADESGAAADVARHLDLPHLVVDSRADGTATNDGPAALEDMYGVPNDNLTALSVAQMSRAARRHMTVALGGMGGDELFFGYGRHALFWRWRHWFRLLPPFVDMAQRVAGSTLERLPAWRKLRRHFHGDSPWRYLATKSYPAGDILAALPGADSAVRGAWRETPGAPPVTVARDVDTRLVMPGSYIPAIDRGSMRASVEVRTPFLSRALVEALESLDQRALIAGGPKHVLRTLLRRDLPDYLVDRPKQGFIFPAARFLAALGTAPPNAGLPESLAGEVWRRRAEYGFAALAIRLSVLARFHATFGPR